MNKKEWKFYDLPVKYNLEDYNEAKEAVSKKIGALPEVVSVFEAGKVAYPGISDIDFLIVFDEKADNFFIPYEPIYSDRVKYMMRHKVFLLSEKFYKDYLYLNPLLRFVYKDKNQQDVLSSKKNLFFDVLDFNMEEQKTLDSFFCCIDILLGRFRGVKSQLGDKFLVRQELISLKGVEYMLNIINLYNLDKSGLLKGGDEFITKLDNLNKNWFNLDKEKALDEIVDLYEQGLRFNFKIAFVFSDFFKSISSEMDISSNGIKKRGFLHSSWLDKNYRNVYFHNFGAAYLCSEAIKTPEEALEATLKMFSEHDLNLLYRKKKLVLPVIALPFNFSTVFLILAQGKGLLSKAIKEDIFTNSHKLPFLKSDVIDTRVDLINDLTKVYFEKGLELSDGKGYLYGGNNVYQYQFGKEKLRRRLATFYLRIKYWFQVRKLKELLK